MSDSSRWCVPFRTDGTRTARLQLLRSCLGPTTARWTRSTGRFWRTTWNPTCGPRPGRCWSTNKNSIPPGKQRSKNRSKTKSRCSIIMAHWLFCCYCDAHDWRNAYNVRARVWAFERSRCATDCTQIVINNVHQNAILNICAFFSVSFNREL